MGLRQSVSRMLHRCQTRSIGIGAPHRQTAGSHGIGGEHIPKGTDAQTAVGIEEVGMGEVETDVHHPHHHSFTIEGLGKPPPLVYCIGCNYRPGGIHLQRTGSRCLETLDHR